MSFTPSKGSKGLELNKSIANQYTRDNLAGTKWSHVSTGRTGINSILDKDIINDHLQTKKRNMGAGFLKLRLQDHDRAKPTPINIGGRLMYPDDEGNYIIIDTSVVNEMQKAEEEKRSYLESVIEKASLSNDICALILGCKDADELEQQYLGVGASGGGRMSSELIATDSCVFWFESNPKFVLQS